MEEKKTVQTEVEKPRDRAVLAGLSSPRLDKRDNADEDTLEELGALVETAGGEVAAVVLQNRAAPEPRTFIGEGRWQRSGSWCGTRRPPWSSSTTT